MNSRQKVMLGDNSAIKKFLDTPQSFLKDSPSRVSHDQPSPKTNLTVYVKAAGQNITSNYGKNHVLNQHQNYYNHHQKYSNHHREQQMNYYQNQREAHFYAPHHEHLPSLTCTVCYPNYCCITIGPMKQAKNTQVFEKSHEFAVAKKNKAVRTKYQRVNKTTIRSKTSIWVEKERTSAVFQSCDELAIANAAPFVMQRNHLLKLPEESKSHLRSEYIRGITMRPSGKWQAQLYYAGSSCYIGVFISEVDAVFAYNIVRSVVKLEQCLRATSPEETEKYWKLARKAAHVGVNNMSPILAAGSSKKESEQKK